MSSAIHAVLVETFEAHPEALEYLLSLYGNAPSGALIPTAGTRVKTVTLERRVDRAYLVGSRKEPSGFLLAEVQLDIDDAKKLSHKVGHAHDRLVRAANHEQENEADGEDRHDLAGS